MKRLLTSAAMFLCSLLTFAQFSGSGSGTENDPYLIFNPIQLNQMRNFLNKNGVYFKLMADIDLTEFVEDEYPSQGWLPIGSTSAPFRGILDGNSHVISGLWISRENSEDVGFFGNTSSCTIKNLTISAEKIEGKNSVGVIFGCSSKSLISRCTVSGKVNGFDNVGGCVGSGDAVTLQEVKSMVEITGHNQVGGLIGQARGNGVSSSSSPTILGCKIVCQNIKGNDYIGGLCGSYNGTHAIIESCFVNADICGNNYVGGITGQVQNVGKYNSHGSSCNIIKCGYSGDISGNSYVGGISGEHSSQATLDKCFALARINAIGNNIGGIVGYSDGTYNQVYETLSNSYFSGSVIGGSYTSGIVGYKYQGRIENCYSNASVAGTECVGGIFGYARGYNEYHNFKSTANIANLTNIKASKGKIGRIYGEKDSNAFVGEIGTAADNKALNKAIVIKAGVAQDVNDSEQNGTGVSSTTLKLKATYVAMGWDFNDTWEIQETESYPYFKIQTAPPVITSQVVSGATAISGKCIDGGTVTLEIDGVKQQMVSIGNTFSFTVSPLQAGHEVRVSAKAEGKEQSYYTTETIAYLGKGTESDPYQVYTASDLTGVYRKGYFKLMNDIDLTSYINQFSPTEGWQSIGREGSETIHFDGNGHKITGLWCNSTRDNTGLFSCFANGSIKNLTVVTANGKQVKGGANTGILIGKLINGTITNCKVTGTVADGTPVGGMIGMLEGGKLIGCQADVTINVTGEDSNVGGLAGEVTGDVEQCLSYGTLTATGKDSYVGGLVGLSKSGSSISNSYSSAVVNSSLSAAGIVAYNYGVVDKCYAVGNLFSKNYGAGVVGYNDGEGAVVKNCAAMNNKIDVTYESQSAQGGNYGMRIIGGIKNGAPAPEMNNYALKTMQVSVNDVPQKLYDDIMNGTAKTVAQLKSEATYKELGWDFNTIWKIEEGSSYPYQEVVDAKVKLSKSKATIQKGKTLTLKATITPSDLPDKSVTWESSNTKVATVTSAGKVKGVKAGTTTITCTSNSTGAKATCKVTVGYVKLDKTEATILKGKTTTLTATVYPSSLTDKSVTWESSNTKIATVTSAGKVKGVKVGTATITCTSNSTGLKATCKVTVENGLVTLNKTEAYVQKGKTMTLKATVSPETLTDKSVTWESSDKKIATVTKAGKVKGVKYGTATITCTSVATGAKATCQVTVGKVVVSISEVSIKKSRGITLEATVYPEDLADKSVTWKSSDKSIATVDEEGRVKGIKAGTATITCTSVATGLKGTCTVTVLSTSEARSTNGEDDELTDIKELESSAAAEPFDVYDLSGHKVLHQVTSLDGLPDGIYIVNGKKVLKKK